MKRVIFYVFLSFCYKLATFYCTYIHTTDRHQRFPVPNVYWNDYFKIFIEFYIWFLIKWSLALINLNILHEFTQLGSARHVWAIIVQAVCNCSKTLHTSKSNRIHNCQPVIKTKKIWQWKHNTCIQASSDLLIRNYIWASTSDVWFLLLPIQKAKIIIILLYALEGIRVPPVSWCTFFQ